MDEFVYYGPYGYIEEANYQGITTGGASGGNSETDEEQNQEIAKLNEAVSATSEAVAANTENIETLQSDVDEIKGAGYQTEDQVKDAISEVVDGAPDALDTLKEIADKLSDNDDAVAGLVNSVASAQTAAEAADAKADAVKEELEAKIEEKADASALNETNNAVAALSDRVDAIDVPTLSGYATEEWVEEQGFASADDLTAEITRAMNKEGELAELIAEKASNDSLTEEKERAEAAEQALDAKVETKANASTVADELTELKSKDTELEAKDAAQDEEIAKKVEWTESTSGRNHIVLKNHDSILGTATDGTTYNLAMVSKWDVADFGTAQLHANLNSKDGVVTINDDKAIATKDDVEAVEAKVDAIDLEPYAKTADVNTALESKANASDLAALNGTVEGLSSKVEEKALQSDLEAEVARAEAKEAEIETKLSDLEAKDEAQDAEIALKAVAADVYTKGEVDTKVEGYVPVEQYNELKARLDEIEIMLSVYNAEREAQIDEIIANMSSDNKEVVTDTLMESIVVPETTVAYTITAPLTDNSTVELTSPKYMTLINTSKEPVSTTISHEYAEGETTAATSVYLVGDFDTLTLENVSPSVKSGYDAASVKNVVIPETNVKNLSLALDFQDGATITNNSDKDITITDKNDSAIALTVVAPNSTVTLSSGQFTTLNAEVSDNTLIIKKNVHIANLNLEKGNAIVEVARQEEVAGIVENYTVADGYSVSHRIYHITNENSGKLGGVGEMILDEDIVRTASIVAPLAPAYDAVWNLNGHNLTVEGTPKSGVYLNRYASNLEVKGDGVIHCEGSYGLWNNGTTGKIIVNDGVTVEAQTHAIYAEKGVIEINGGIFKLTNWADADKDENGNLRFLLNCLDANYKNGTANIIVKGGKFYDFDPANCAAEGVGTSFVAEGYESVASTETIDGVEHKVYTVKKVS